MKKIIAFLKKYQLVIGLALIAGLVVSYKLLFPSQPTQPTPLPISPTPSPFPTPTPISENSGRGVTEQDFAQYIINQFPLSYHLPYPGSEFSIRYLGPLKLEITIKQATSAAIRKKALDWIRAQGVDPQTHEIIWR